MNEIRYILRRTSDNRVLCRPSHPGKSVTWELEQFADQTGVTMVFTTQKGVTNALKNYGTNCVEIVRQEKAEELTVSEQITNYLVSGGLFNPELANHGSIRDLLIHARNEFDKLEALPIQLNYEQEEQFLP